MAKTETSTFTTYRGFTVEHVHGYYYIVGIGGEYRWLWQAKIAINLYIANYGIE